jgi:hypothetical protein
MLVKVTVEILADDESEKAIAEGIIVGALDITRGSGEHSTKPLLTVKMRNILAAVQKQIFEDSNAPEV